MIQSEYIKKISDNTSGVGWARIISDIFNPILLPLVVFSVAFFSLEEQIFSAVKLLAFVTVLFSVIPLAGAWIMLKFQKRTTIDFNQRRSRYLLYIISIASYSAGGLLLTSNLFSESYRVITLIYLANLIVAFLLNFRWKVSVHTGTAFTSIILLLWLGFYLNYGFVPTGMALIFLFLSPLIFYARQHLNVHTWPELFLGALTGVVVSVVGLWFLHV